MTPDDLLRHLESLLFVSPEPAEIAQLAAALDVPVGELEPAIDELAERCMWRGIRVQRKGQRVQLASSPDAAPYVEKYLGLNAVTRLSQAALETLAIIAYRQPITRPEIEVLRGVDCDGVLRTLTARQLITEVGRLDTVGHPIRYGTTFEFLRYFGLERLDQMPSLNVAEPPTGGAAPSGSAAHESDITEPKLEERLHDEHQDASGYPASDQFPEDGRDGAPQAEAGFESQRATGPRPAVDWDAALETQHPETAVLPRSPGNVADGADSAAPTNTIHPQTPDGGTFGNEAAQAALAGHPAPELAGPATAIQRDTAAAQAVAAADQPTRPSAHDPATGAITAAEPESKPPALDTGPRPASDDVRPEPAAEPHAALDR